MLREYSVLHPHSFNDCNMVAPILPPEEFPIKKPGIDEKKAYVTTVMISLYLDIGVHVLNYSW